MSYCTAQNLLDRFGEDELISLTDRAGLGIVDQAVLGQAIADAAAEIDAYLRVRYPLPLVAVPAELMRASCDIVRYALYDQQAPEQVDARYEQALAFIKALGAGRAALPDSALPAVAPGIAQATPPSRAAVFTGPVLAMQP